MVRWALVFPIVLASLFLFAQENEHTMQFDSLVGSPKASLNELAWISGTWEGMAFGGITEEVWSLPKSGSMMGMFKLIDGDQISFYELMTISQEKETLIMRLKHFNHDLTGWEEKDEVLNFRLVKVEEHKIYFEGLTFERINENEINVYVLISEKEEKTEEYKFQYKRKK